MTKASSTLTGIVIVVVMIVGIILMFASKPQPPKKPVQVKMPLVEVLAPQAEAHQFMVESHGVVMPRTETSLVSEVSGQVESVSDKFFAGGYFEKGEVLLQIDPTDYQVGVEQAKARLISAQAQYAQEKARAEQAQKEWDLSGRSRSKAPALALREPFLLEAEANVQSAEADLKKAQQKLARTTIRAPYAGMVKEKRADVGQYVSVGTSLGVTFATDYAEVRLPLTDEDLAFVNLPSWSHNDSSQYPLVDLSTTYAGQERHWQGRLVRMEGVVDQTSRVHYAVVRVDDPYAMQQQTQHPVPLKVGTFVTAHINGIEYDNVVKIPREAFRDLEKVLVSDTKNELHIRSLSIVRAENDFVYVKEGLQDGDQIVLTSIESPIEGMKLRIEGQEVDNKSPEPVTPEKTEVAKSEASEQPQP